MPTVHYRQPLTLSLMDEVIQLSHAANTDLSTAGSVSVFTQPDSLPGAQVQLAVRHRHRQVGAKETCLHVSRLKQRDVCSYLMLLTSPEYSHHVIWSLTRMSEWKIFWNYSVKHHLHVVPHVWVPVLIDGQRRAGVKQLDVHQPNTELRQLRKLKTLDFGTG